MQVFYKSHPAEVWEISKTNARPDWVQAAFAMNYLTWLDDRLRITMAGLSPVTVQNSDDIKTSDFQVHAPYFGVVAIGYPGDYLDVTNHRVVSKEKFLKQYQQDYSDPQN